MPSAHANSRPRGRRLTVASTVAAAWVAVTLATGASSSAQSDQLSEVRAKQEQIRNQLAEQNAAVDALLGEVAVVRHREKRASAQLAEQEAELAAARAELTRAREELARTKRHLTAARGDLRRLLVSIYRSGQPDAATVLLNSASLDEFATRTEYLERVQDYQAGVVDQVRELRTETRGYVADVESSVARIEAARAQIAQRQQELASSRAELEEREAALNAAQSERRRQLQNLVGKEKSLVEALSTPAPAASADSGTTTAAPTESVAPPNGSTASINSDGTATAPADAPQAVQDVIAAGNAITNSPYLYGGGHGSFDSPGGYDCSGSVSYALHGGGLLAAPLDSTGFMTWGDPGPGSWITVYSNPGHAYMVVAGIRFDTSGAPPRWQPASRDSTGFVATHPPGY
jgi:septal ring factor EnvC (AmiA/AmiB activator)